MRAHEVALGDGRTVTEILQRHLGVESFVLGVFEVDVGLEARGVVDGVAALVVWVDQGVIVDIAHTLLIVRGSSGVLVVIHPQHVSRTGRPSQHIQVILLLTIASILENLALNLLGRARGLDSIGQLHGGDLLLVG